LRLGERAGGGEKAVQKSSVMIDPIMSDEAQWFNLLSFEF
jgi:hypothetical protein